MKNRRLIPFLLTAALIFLLIPAESAAVRGGQPAFLMRQPEAVLAASGIGSRVKLTVTLAGAAQATRGKIFLTYDTDKLMYTSCTAAPIGGAGISNARSPDRIIITWDADVPIGDDALLATLEFKAFDDVEAGTAVVFTPAVHEVLTDSGQILNVTAEPLEVTLP